MKYYTEIAMTAALLLMIMILCCGQFFAAAQRAQEEVLRLHILANSDSEEDQQLKLLVRDHILQEVSEWFLPETDRNTVERIIQQRLAEITVLAQERVKEEGYDYPVSVQLCHSDFPTREYDGFTLPAGDYDALRILIGEGKGQNWWCIMFPPLCVPTALSEESAAWFEEHGLEFLEQEPCFEPRFALLEWWQQIQK